LPGPAILSDRTSLALNNLFPGSYRLSDLLLQEMNRRQVVLMLLFLAG
jgi:hypothetical protein